MLSDKGTDSPVAAGFVGDPRIQLFSLSRNANPVQVVASHRPATPQPVDVSGVLGATLAGPVGHPTPVD